MEYSGARGTLLHEKKLKSKISCQTPFKDSDHAMRNKGGREAGKLKILVSDRGDRCPFLFLFCRHLGLNLFPFRSLQPNN